METTYKYSRKLYVSTNSTCNLDCIYCFEKEKKPFEFNVDDTISIIKAELSNITEYGTQISLRGGEPFMIFSKIKDLCEKLWKEDIKEYFHFHITTNGTLIHGEIKEWLAQNKDKVTIKLSLDGNKKSSDINRPKSFNKIDFPFIIKNWPDIRVNMTVTAETMPYLADNIIFIHSLGFRHIISHFSIMTDWGKCHLERTLYEQLLILIDFYLENPELEPCGFFRNDISRTLLKEPSHIPCNKALKAYDSQTKKYYPCYMCFPSIGGENIAEEFNRIDFEHLEEEPCCKNCPFINLCATCYAENYISRGSVTKRDMSLCNYQKVQFVASFLFEFKRILKLENPSNKDILKMEAIQEHLNTIKSIETRLYGD